ncbi:MAG: COQ9 family protein [Rhodospirillales bacterium]|nr:COQ9 family protein [Rhodospirillales bacterium]
MDSAELRERVLLGLLPHVSFDGWTERSLRAGARDAGLAAEEGLRAFPTGMLEAVEYFCEFGDRRMVEELAKRNLMGLRVRERVAAAVRCRLDVVADHREAVRRALAFMALPQNAGAASRCAYRTVDVMWYAAGDASTDFNFYTKRALLAGVYAATILCWLADVSEGNADTWAFLDRRINGIMTFGQVQGRLTKAVSAKAGHLVSLSRRCLPLSRFRSG